MISWLRSFSRLEGDRLGARSDDVGGLLQAATEETVTWPKRPSWKCSVT